MLGGTLASPFFTASRRTSLRGEHMRPRLSRSAPSPPASLRSPAIWMGHRPAVMARSARISQNFSFVFSFDWDRNEFEQFAGQALERFSLICQPDCGADARPWSGWNGRLARPDRNLPAGRSIAKTDTRITGDFSGSAVVSTASVGVSPKNSPFSPFKIHNSPFIPR